MIYFNYLFYLIYFKEKTPKIPQHLTFTWCNLNTEDRQIWLLHFSRNFLFTLKKERSVVAPVMWIQNSIKIPNFLLCVTCFLSPWVGAVITVQFLYPIFISWSFQELHKICECTKFRCFKDSFKGFEKLLFF